MTKGLKSKTESKQAEAKGWDIIYKLVSSANLSTIELLCIDIALGTTTLNELAVSVPEGD